MATVREVVLPHHKKEDGTWNVKIRVTHNRKSTYIDTQHYVGAKQLKKDFRIKDQFILDLIYPLLIEYRTKISELGSKLTFYNCKTLAHYLLSGGQVRAEDINIIEFGREQIKELRLADRNGSADDMRRVVNSLVDFFKTDQIPITHIRAGFLAEYESFLTAPRMMTRINQGKPATRKVKGLGKTGLHNHMRDLRILFNDVCDFYNDEDMEILVVKHNPFKKHKIGKPAKNSKAKLNIKQVRKIMTCEVPQGSRIELARDLAMLSFYLCGMNAADLYRLPPANLMLTKTRFNYNRKKTMTRREDEAFMSVNIPDAAVPLIKKYAGTLQNRYSTPHALDQAIFMGMAGLRKITRIKDLDFYDLRHAFGDIARNVLYFDKDDVAEALNHVNYANKVTDIYLERSWEIIDLIQYSMIEFLINNRLLRRYKQISIPA